MTTSFLKMNRLTVAFIFSVLTLCTLLSACNKLDIFNPRHPNDTGADSPDNQSATVIEKWMALQVRLMKNTSGVPNQAFSRYFAYSGIAAWEAVAPGVPEQARWSNKWNGLTQLPEANPYKKYYWPASANAALADMNRIIFVNATDTDKGAIDSLENALRQQFMTGKTAALVPISVAFGKRVALAVYNWMDDGFTHAGDPYTPPTGPGLWVPTPPAFSPASTPYWGNNRPVIKGSITKTMAAPPVIYSTSNNSAFYNMVKQVYDASQTLTPEQQAIALYWRDVPGVTSPGHWLSILQQTVQQKKPSLAKAALAYALTGSAINDALISCWQSKYQYNLVRPITYIRDVMGYTSWNSFLTTPPHPEYPSAHATLSGAAAAVLDKLFGNYPAITDHTYDYLGYAPRTYASYYDIGLEAGQSRLYAGIHYQASIDAGLQQGKKVVDNIFSYPAFK